MAPSRRGFARKLWRLADLVQAAERRRSFRAKAYRQAIWSLDRLDPELDVSQEELLATPGIGPGVAALVTEYRATGTFNQLIPLESALPLDTPRLRRLPRMTPKILHEMKTGLGIETVDDLAAAIETGAAATLPGAGAQTLELWRRILDLRPGPDAVPAHQAWVTAMALANHFEAHTGSRVEVAMFEALCEWMMQPLLYAHFTGKRIQRSGADHVSIVPYGRFTARDGKDVMMGIQNEREWAQFCEKVLRRPELARDPRFDSNSRRLASRDELLAIVREVFATMTAAELVERLDEASIANARMNEMDEVWAHAQLPARKRWTEMGSPVGAIPVLRPPATHSDFEPEIGAVPAVGEHTATILAEVGLAPVEIERLRAERVV